MIINWTAGRGYGMAEGIAGDYRPIAIINWTHELGHGIRAGVCAGALVIVFTCCYNLVVDNAHCGVIIGAWEAIVQPIQHRMRIMRQKTNVIYGRDGKPETLAVNQGVTGGWDISYNPDDARFYVSHPTNTDEPHRSYNALRNARQWARNNPIA